MVNCYAGCYLENSSSNLKSNVVVKLAFLCVVKPVNKAPQFLFLDETSFTKIALNFFI